MILCKIKKILTIQIYSGATSKHQKVAETQKVAPEYV